ncbi:MAG: molybdopterin molybdotransferase MoeA [Alphaproteobacteria bacterium]|nr:molybdopterin molybdotransferase MoeA [Alphaproteobacteria bacterium]
MALNSGTMISFQEAQKTIREAVGGRRIESECVPLAQSTGRVCAEDIFAPLTVPPFDNSAMDGYAVWVEDIAGASAKAPVGLSCKGAIVAGDPVPDTPVSRGSCVQIMTGAPVPSGALAVVPVELVKKTGEKIVFAAPVTEKANIRLAGEDFKKGQIALPRSSLLSLSHILPLAALGIGQVNVFRKPRVVFLSTGREVIDDLSAPLGPGQIYNSNGPYACAFLEALGAQVIKYATISDDPEHFRKTLVELESLAPDLVVSSGAVSAGVYDFVCEGLVAGGADILFHKVRIKPGKPVLVARLKCGALYFGLPGNPVATASGLRFFVEPALRTMQGRSPENPGHARLMNSYEKKSGLHMFLKGETEGWEDGAWTVEVMKGQASFVVNPFLRMNTWISVPEEKERLKPGEIVEIFPLIPV